MKVTVIGPGAMGCLFAARLAHCGIETTLVDHTPERAARLQRTGLTIEARDGPLKANPTVASEIPRAQDLIVVLTKAYSTDSLSFPSQGRVLTLQNGLGNAETLSALAGAERVVAGTTYEAATLLGEGRVRYVAAGTTTVGAWTTCLTDVAVEALRAAGFEIEVTDAPGRKIWEKVIVNAGINPLTALLNVPNGKLLELPEARQLMRALVTEATRVSACEGWAFKFDPVARTEEVCGQTAENVSSMLQDIRAGKRTEIDAINGEICRRAQRAGLPAPSNRIVWQLVKGLEQR